jgi:hypothetical protein
MDRSTNIFQKFGKLFDPYLIMFRKLKEKKMHLPSQCFYKEKNNEKSYKRFS